MTPQEQIAYLRDFFVSDVTTPLKTAADAVCDLAERALLTDDETEACAAVASGTFNQNGRNDLGVAAAVLRRLLGE